jgi:hypothetical protein
MFLNVPPFEWEIRIFHTAVLSTVTSTVVTVIIVYRRIIEEMADCTEQPRAPSNRTYTNTR